MNFPATLQSYTAEYFILICGSTFCTCISENNQKENGRIIMGFDVIHGLKWWFTDKSLQNDRPKIIDLDSPM